METDLKYAPFIYMTEMHVYLWCTVLLHHLTLFVNVLK